jgi:hypothetical protein
LKQLPIAGLFNACRMTCSSGSWRSDRIGMTRGALRVPMTLAMAETHDAAALYQIDRSTVAPGGGTGATGATRLAIPQSAALTPPASRTSPQQAA